MEVRLNTNESLPFAPPARVPGELSSPRSRDVAYNRYPKTSLGAGATGGALAELHGVEADQVFAANGSNEVLQSICLAYGERRA